MSEAIENNVERMHEKSFFGRGVYGVCFCVVDDVSAVRAKLGLFLGRVYRCMLLHD